MKTHPIEILLRKEKKGKKKKIRKGEVYSLKEAKRREEEVKTLRKVNWNRVGEFKKIHVMKVSGFSWNNGEALTNNIGRD